jgi:hypothetical protein
VERKIARLTCALAVKAAIRHPNKFLSLPGPVAGLISAVNQ